MKIWKIEAFIESEDNICRKDIIKAINYKLNDGDGIYLETGKDFRLRVVKKVKDEEYIEDPLD